MANTIVVKGSNALSEQMRYEALQKINKLDDESLSRLGQMAESSKAKGFIKNSWPMLKKLVGIK